MSQASFQTAPPRANTKPSSVLLATSYGVFGLLSRQMKNKELANVFHEMADIYEMFDVEFKPRAYQKAAKTIDGLDKDIEDIAKGGEKELVKLPGIGLQTAKKILEFLKTGKVKKHQELKKKMPADVLAIAAIEGVGPKIVRELYEQLGVETLKDLEKAVKSKAIQDLSGFGPKKEEMIAKGLKFVKKQRARFLLGEVKPFIDRLIAEIETFPETEEVALAGSGARWNPTIGDLDIVVATMDPEGLFERVSEMKNVKEILRRGRGELFARLDNNMDLDVVASPPKDFGGALLYYSGEKFHNIDLRTLARKKGYKLTGHGLFKGTRQVAGKTEKEIYNKLGLQFIPPELRQTQGVVALAKEKKIPKLLELDDIQGDLHVHSDWTEGTVSIKKMAELAIDRGYSYMAITDHTKFLAFTNGMDEKRIKQQMVAIDKLNKSFGSKFRILRGAEVNILGDGSLDIEDVVLAKLDIVIAGVHSQMGMNKEDMTSRILRAIENSHVDMIVHPTGRILGRRDGYVFDTEQVFKAAAKHKTAMEIDGYGDRLDLPASFIKEAKEFGVKFSCDTDAHDPDHLRYMEFAVHTARRGWAQKKDVLNTRSAAEILKFFKK